MFFNAVVSSRGPGERKHEHPVALARPVTSPFLSKDWKLPLIKNLMDITLFGYCGDTKDEPYHAAKLAASSDNFNEKYNSQFEQAVKKILQHTAQCDYNICFVPDEKNFPDMDEDTLYLLQNKDRNFQYYFITSNQRYSITDDIKITQCNITSSHENSSTDYNERKKCKKDSFDDLGGKFNLDKYYKNRLDLKFKLTSYDIIYKKTSKDLMDHRFIIIGIITPGEIDWAGRIQPWRKIPVRDVSNLNELKFYLSPILKIISERHNYCPPLKAALLAKQNHALILAKNIFTEKWCGREWRKPISPLQYTAWAGDTPLLDEFMKIIADHGLEANALQQLKDVRNSRIERPHLSAILELKNAYEERYPKLISMIAGSGIQRIFKKQSQSVFSLLQWFLSSKPFNDPTETFQKFLEARVQSFNDYDYSSLCEPLDNFGYSWGLVKSFLSEAMTFNLDRCDIFIDRLEDDFSAISRYFEVRCKDLYDRIANLEIKLQKGFNQDQSAAKKSRSCCVVM